MNNQRSDYSIYQAPVLYQMQSGLQAIAYLNLLYLTQPQPQSQRSCHLYHLQYIYIIPNIPHDSRHVPAEVFIYPIKVKLRPIYLSDLGATGLLTRKPLTFLVNVLTFIEDETDVRIREKF